MGVVAALELLTLRRKFRNRSSALSAAAQPFHSEVQLCSIWYRQQQVSNRHRRVASLDQVAHGVEVALRLGHLLAFDLKELGVKPVANERPFRSRPPTERSRSRDAGRSDRRRRNGCRTTRRGTSSTSPSIRDANPAAPHRTACAISARSAPLAPSTKRNRGHRPCRTHQHPPARRRCCLDLSPESCRSRKRTDAEIERAVTRVGVTASFESRISSTIPDVFGRPRHDLGPLDVQQIEVFQKLVGIELR